MTYSDPIQRFDSRLDKSPRGTGEETAKLDTDEDKGGSKTKINFLNPI